jgi:hypothetical protein
MPTPQYIDEHLLFKTSLSSTPKNKHLLPTPLSTAWQEKTKFIATTRMLGRETYFS